MAYSILPFEALCKKATMCAAYTAKKFGFGRAFGFEDLRDRAIDQGTECRGSRLCEDVAFHSPRIEVSRVLSWECIVPTMSLRPKPVSFGAIEIIYHED